MKKNLRIMNLDCANCAAKMEEAIKQIDGVINVSISFMAQRMTIEIEDDYYEAVMKKVGKVCKKIEPDCVIKI